MADLKNNLKELREKQNLSLEDLSRKANIPPKIIEKVENKNYNLSIKNAIKIANALKTEVEEIFFID